MTRPAYSELVSALKTVAWLLADISPDGLVLAQTRRLLARVEDRKTFSRIRKDFSEREPATNETGSEVQRLTSESPQS